MPAGAAEQPAARSEAPASLAARDALGLAVGLAALCALVYRGALHGPFVSDDGLYYLSNPYVQALSAENLAILLDPFGAAARATYNYAPLHLLLISVQWQLFGAEPLGHHLVGLGMHVLNCVLLVALLIASGLPRHAALLGGLLFALHPANVEVVAWMSQQKSLAALAFGLGALLLWWRHPAWASLLFGLALLTKFLAAGFLPMAAAFAWSRRAPRRTWAWLGLWLCALSLVAIPQLAAFGGGGGLPDELSLWARLRSAVAFGATYLWMALSGLGLSAFHEPEAARSPLDPRWLAGLLAGALLAGRAGWTLYRRREEGAWWVGAAAAFVPVSQAASFRYPLADRYLYFMLPGLIGALLWLVTTDGARLWQRAAGRRLQRALPHAAFAAGALLALGFGLHATARVPLWQNDFQLFVDAARTYPSGSQAHYVRAVRAARRGDAERAVAELRAGEAVKPLSLINDFAADPRLAPIRHTRAFQEFLLDTARWRIEWVDRFGIMDGEQLQVAFAHQALGHTEQAVALAEEFLRLRPDDRRRPMALALLEELRGHRPPRPAPDAPKLEDLFEAAPAAPGRAQSR